MATPGAWFGTSDLVAFPKLVGLACCFGIFAAMFAIAVRVSRRPVLLTLVAGGATATVPSFVIWTTSGLENGLFALVVVAIAAVLARAAADGRLLALNTALGVGGLAALAALTRPDGVIYVAAFPLAAALTFQRSTLRRMTKASLVSLAGFTLPVATYLGWRLVMFGGGRDRGERSRPTPRALVREMDAAAIDAPDRQFDLAVFAFSFHHLPPSLASLVFAEGTRVADKLLIIDLPRPPSPLHVLRLAAMLPLAPVIPFVHDGLISSLRTYSPSALRALAAHADPAIDVQLRGGLMSPQIVVASRSAAA